MAATVATNFTFAVVSKRHGLTAEVTAPERYRAEIEAHSWSLMKGNNGPFYLRAKIRKRIVLLHRFIWGLAGRPPCRAVDHQDRDTMNNAEDNLRDGSAGNVHNVGLRRDNTSGYKGVTHHRKSGKWQARIRLNTKETYLGLFSTPLDAARAYNEAAPRFHGEFAYLNDLAGAPAPTKGTP